MRLVTEFERFMDGLPPDDVRRKWVDDMQQVLAENMFAGDNVPKDRIPRYYRDKYGINTLFRYDHPDGYRSTYTIRNVGDGVSVFIFDIMSHREYDKRFGYRTS